jgi:hypothetical protein
VQPINENDSSHDLILPNVPEITNGKENNFKIEVNLGLALPFRYYIDENAKFEKQKSVVRTVDDSGSIYMLEVTTQSDEGPLQSVENDVLLVLLTMAFEQRSLPVANQSLKPSNDQRVYYTLAEICRRLGLSENNSNRISKAIKRIASQNLSFKNFRYHSPTGKILQAEENTKIILKNGRIRSGGTRDGFLNNHSDYFYVEFDHNIIKNLYDEYVSVVEQKEYLSLSAGHQRRILIFLYSKKRSFGSDFLFNLNELANVIGLQDSQKDKRRRLIFEYLQKTREITGVFDFSITKIREKEDWEIMIHFHDPLTISHKCDQFFEDLVFEYGAENLASIDFNEIDLENYRREFDAAYLAKTGSDKYKWNKNEHLASEFCLDLTFWQIFKCNYKITKTLKALARSILESMMNDSLLYPDKYRIFVTERVAEKKKAKELAIIQQHRHQKELQKIEEEKKFDESFNKLLEDIMKDQKYKKLIEETAKEKLIEEGIRESEMAYTLLFQDKVRSVAKDFLQEFKLFDKRAGLH